MKLVKFGALVISFLFSALLFADGHPVAGASTANLTDENNVAVSGYDTVAYFTQGSAVAGSSEFTTTYDNAIYQFSSAENRDLFNADPAKYAPQYGGYCAFGAARSKMFSVDPTAFKVVEGKLYLNNSSAVQENWAADMANEIALADAAWDSIKNKDASEL